MRPRQSSLGIADTAHAKDRPASFNEAEAIKPRNLQCGNRGLRLQGGRGNSTEWMFMSPWHGETVLASMRPRQSSLGISERLASSLTWLTSHAGFNEAEAIKPRNR